MSAPLVSTIKIWTFYDIQAAVFLQSYVIVLDGSLTESKRICQISGRKVVTFERVFETVFD